VSFRKPYIEQAVRSKWDVADLVGASEEWAAVRLVMSMLRKRGDEKVFK
jgi:hypothetical protein